LSGLEVLVDFQVRYDDLPDSLTRLSVESSKGNGIWKCVHRHVEYSGQGADVLLVN